MHSWFDGHLVYLKDDRIARDCVNQFLEIELKSNMLHMSNSVEQLKAKADFL